MYVTEYGEPGERADPSARLAHEFKIFGSARLVLARSWGSASRLGSLPTLFISIVSLGLMVNKRLDLNTLLFAGVSVPILCSCVSPVLFWSAVPVACFMITRRSCTHSDREPKLVVPESINQFSNILCCCSRMSQLEFDVIGKLVSHDKNSIESFGRDKCPDKVECDFGKKIFWDRRGMQEPCWHLHGRYVPSTGCTRFDIQFKALLYARSIIVHCN